MFPVIQGGAGDSPMISISDLEGIHMEEMVGEVRGLELPVS